MKRFYTNAAIVAGPDGHAIVLDDKPVRTPLGKPLALSGAALAEAVAAEWMTQGEFIRPGAMPLTAIANTAIDRVAANRADAVAQLMRYAESDLLCYRAVEPPALVARQRAVWQAILDWAEARLGAAFAVTDGVMPVAQPPETLAALARAVAAHDDLTLAALSSAVAVTGSLVLGLAMAARRMDAAEAYAAAQLDETFQNEQWGVDPEVLPHRAAVRADLDAAALIFRLHLA